MGSPKTLFILIMVIFVGMMIVNVNSIISGIEEHNTWRIVIAAGSLSFCGRLTIRAVGFFFFRSGKTIFGVYWFVLPRATNLRG